MGAKPRSDLSPKARCGTGVRLGPSGLRHQAPHLPELPWQLRKGFLPETQPPVLRKDFDHWKRQWKPSLYAQETPGPHQPTGVRPSKEGSRTWNVPTEAKLASESWGSRVHKLPKASSGNPSPPPLIRTRPANTSHSSKLEGPVPISRKMQSKTKIPPVKRRHRAPWKPRPCSLLALSALPLASFSLLVLTVATLK